MLKKKSNGAARATHLSSMLAGLGNQAVDRRAFLKRSGIAFGGAAALTGFSGGMVKKAQAQSAAAGNIDPKSRSLVLTSESGCTTTVVAVPFISAAYSGAVHMTDANAQRSTKMRFIT